MEAAITNLNYTLGFPDDSFRHGKVLPGKFSTIFPQHDFHPGFSTSSHLLTLAIDYPAIYSIYNKNKLFSACFFSSSSNSIYNNIFLCFLFDSCKNDHHIIEKVMLLLSFFTELLLHAIRMLVYLVSHLKTTKTNTQTHSHTNVIRKM